MLKSEKPGIVNALEGICKDSNSIIITHYQGLTVNQLETLRKALKSKNASFKVIKNTLIKLAVTKLGLEDASKLFTGPTAIAYSEDPINAAKVVAEFSKTNKNLKIIAGIVNNQILDEKSILELSKLPSLDELRGKIIALLQAPATKLVGVLKAPSLTIARLLKAYSDK